MILKDGSLEDLSKPGGQQSVTLGQFVALNVFCFFFVTWDCNVGRNILACRL